MVCSAELRRPGYRALRRGRHSLRNQAYLVTTATYLRTPVFEDAVAARLVVATMRELQRSAWLDSIAWVLMPDHLHWLFYLRDASGGLPAVMRSLKGNSGRSINRAFKRTGRLWQPGYHDRAIRRDEDLQEVSRYIVANPLRAGLVASLGEYAHWDAVWLRAAPAEESEADLASDRE